MDAIKELIFVTIAMALFIGVTVGVLEVIAWVF